MKKIKKFVKCHGPTFDFNVAVIGDGKNPTLYFIEDDDYYPCDFEDPDFDGEKPIEVGTPATVVEDRDYFLHMDLKTFKKIAEKLLK